MNLQQRIDLSIKEMKRKLFKQSRIYAKSFLVENKFSMKAVKEKIKYTRLLASGWETHRKLLPIKSMGRDLANYDALCARIYIKCLKEVM